MPMDNVTKALTGSSASDFMKEEIGTGTCSR